MSPLFLFGTLQHKPLLEAVLGSCAHLDPVPAVLPNHRCFAVAEGPFPLVKVDQTAQVTGLLLKGLTADDAEKLNFFEACFDYTLKEIVLANGQVAQSYFPTSDRWTTNGDWSLDAWIRDWADLSVLSAREVMSYRSEKTPSEVAGIFPMIRARAWSRLNAARSLHGAMTLPGEVQVKDHRRPYAQYFALDEYDLTHDRFEGGVSREVRRAVFLAPDAALLLPYDPVRDRVLLVEQMRMGPVARGDRSLWQLEPIAGRLDPGETPEDAARREAREEADLDIGELFPVAQSYCSPGTSTEFHYTFVGIADLPDEISGLGGEQSEDEDIRSHIVDFKELMRMCDAQEIGNSPLVMTAYWLAQHRDEIRASLRARK